MDDGGGEGVDERFLGHQASQRFGADLLNQQKGKIRSGDDDLSGKLPLSQRRAKLDGAKSRQAARWILTQLATVLDSAASSVSIAMHACLRMHQAVHKVMLFAWVCLFRKHLYDCVMRVDFWYVSCHIEGCTLPATVSACLSSSMTTRFGFAGQMLLAVMMKKPSQERGNASLLKTTSTERPKRWQRAKRHQRKASTVPLTPYPPSLIPQLRAQGPSPMTLRRTEGSHPTEARPQKILGNTTETSLRKQRCGAKAKYRRLRVGLLVGMVGRRPVSSLVLPAASGSDCGLYCSLSLQLY